MTSEIYIVSGFLGAGKTTFIQKMLKEAFINEKVVLIENDFGEISVDAALMKSGGVEVKEIHSGCICCSLSGDFVKALNELLNRFKPDKIIIEPSGVGKLSDIMKVCTDTTVKPFARVKAKLTIVDVKRCKMYLDNFGEFFEDQIQNADVVVLSRTEDYPDKINDACKLIKDLNEQSPIFSKPWEQIHIQEILFPKREHHSLKGHLSHANGCSCGQHSSHHHEGHGHGHTCDCDCHHSAEDVFDTITIQTTRIFSMDELRTRISYMERNSEGTILRAKGIIRSTKGYVNLQYLPGDLNITPCDVGGDMLCIIGQNLNQKELIRLFNKE